MIEPPEKWPGKYRWVEIDGITQSTSSCWSDIPDRINRIIYFIPDGIPEPHTQNDHDILESLRVKFREVMGRNK